MMYSLLENRLLPLVLSFSLLIICAVPVTAKSAVERVQAKEAAESTSAVTMQLMKTEGDVSITNDRGREITFLEKMKLYSGYHVETQEASYAWINMDGTKLTKLDAASEMEVRKSCEGGDLEILLNSGKLLFNVTEPLTDDETLKVRTSTMTVGIRGTSGWVEVNDRGDTRVYLLEGKVECGVTDPVTGQTKETALSNGEMADFLVYPQEKEGDKCDIIRYGFTEDDIDGFVLVEAVQDEELCRKIYDASGLDLMSCADEAEEHLKVDQEKMRERLQMIEAGLVEQEYNVAVEPVWGGEVTSETEGIFTARSPKTEQAVNDGEENIPAVPDEEAGAEAAKAEESKKAGTAGNSENADVTGNISSSADSGSSDSIENPENAEGVWDLDDFWSLVDMDMMEDVQVPNGTENTGSSAVTEAPTVPKEITLTGDVSQAEILEALENYDRVIVIPQNGVSLEGVLNVPVGKEVQIQGEVRCTDSSLHELKGAISIERVYLEQSMLIIADPNAVVERIYNCAGYVNVNSGAVGNIECTLTMATGSYATTVNVSGGEVGSIVGQVWDLSVSEGRVGTVNASIRDLFYMTGGQISDVEQEGGDLRMAGGNITNLNLESCNVTIDNGTVTTLTQNAGTLTVNGGTVTELKYSDVEYNHTGGTVNGKGPSDGMSATADSDFDQPIVTPTASEAELESGESDISQDASSEKEGLSDEEETESDTSREDDSSADVNVDTEMPSETGTSEPPTDEGSNGAGTDSANNGTDNTANMESADESTDNSDPAEQQPTDRSTAEEPPVLPEQFPIGEIPILPEQLPTENIVDEYMQTNREEEWEG